MNNLNIIDRFLDAFIRYIDSGFGLLQGDVSFLATTLIALDITLAALFWSLDGEGEVVARLVRKVLYVGAFAFIIGNFQNLADILYRSFATLGITASGGGISAADLLKPGRLAGTGFQAAHPLLVQVSQLLGFPEFFGNALTIFVLLLAWFLVITAFFILSVQLFITILEFKLTTLAGFVLVPFALWGKSAFLAERVLGNVISSGIKVMVLAVITGIGSGFFGDFTTALNGQDADVGAAMALVLASLALLGLGIFGPAIASGLVSGAPQLGAGAAIGAAGAAAGATLLAGGAAIAGARMAGTGGLAAIRAGTAMGSAASTAWQLGRATSGEAGAAGVMAGLGGITRAAGGAMARGMGGAANRATSALKEGTDSGRAAGWTATGGRPTAAMADAAEASSSSSAPDWAQRLRAEQATRARVHATTQAIKEGDRPGAPANPDLQQKEE